MTTQQLLIMRHAKAERDAVSRHDFDRPLSKRGTRDAGKTAAWLIEQNITPDLLISSPARRTKDTAEIVAWQLTVNTADIIWEKSIYDASLNDLLQVIKKYSGDIRSILLIGHNPGLDMLLCHLASVPPDRTVSGKLMTTSALAILDYGTSPLSGKRHSATLHKLIRPADLP